MGEKISGSQLDQCSPISTNADIATPLYSIVEPYEELNPTDTAYPCGLIAKSIFTDTFVMYSEDPDTVTDASVVEFDTSNIAWKSDRKKFKNQDGDRKALQWYDVED